MRVPHRCLEVCREISDDYERLNMILTVWFEGFALQSWWFAVARCWKVDPSFCCCRCRCVFFAVSCVQTDINTIWGKLQVSSLVSIKRDHCIGTVGVLIQRVFGKEKVMLCRLPRKKRSWTCLNSCFNAIWQRTMLANQTSKCTFPTG